jgi:hypothetical protein
MPQLIPTKFNFKARTIKDENGKEIGKSKKQPALEANLPQPTIEEVVAIVMDSIYSGVRDQAKAQLDEYIDSMDPNEDKTVTADVLDYDKLDIVYIANLPPAQRGARAIPEEDWEAFFQDYLQVMVSVTGKPEANIKNHLEHFKKPTRIKQAKEILAVLVEQLDVYMASSSNIEETGECSARVRGKFAKWLEEDTKFDVSAL